MKIHRQLKRAVIFLVFFLTGISLYSKILFKIEGDYILYSYDYNYIYGKGNIKLTSSDFIIQGNTAEIDVDKKKATITTSCKIFYRNKVYMGDVVEIDLDKLNIDYFLLGKKIVKKSLPSRDKKIKSMPFIFSHSRGIGELKKSLLYFIGKKMVIKKNLDIKGYKVIVFVEGLHSIAFKKIKMNKGIADPDTLFSINKIWYYSSIGLATDVLLNYQKKTEKNHLKSHSSLRVGYDIFKKKTSGSAWEFFFNSLNSLELPKKNTINLNLNHITENMTGASLNYQSQPSKFIQTTLGVDYQKPFNVKEETWLRSMFGFNLKKFGSLNLNLNYEKRKQFRGNFFYNNKSIKNLSFSFSRSISNLLTKENLSNKLSAMNFSLKYSTKIFNLSADYSLNKDIVHDQSQINPRIDLNFTPFTLYRGLIRFNILSSLNINHLKKADIKDYTYRANVALDINSTKLHLTKQTDLNFSLRLEQFIDKDQDNNLTTAGIILRGKQNIFDFAILELLYNYQTRRRTQKWFISGTNSQDLSAVLKLKEIKGGVKLWTSISYNSKIGKFTTGYLNFDFNIIKNWKIQTLLNYDFEFKNLNYNLYLIRRAGRIALRISYRSLSRKFLLEIIPAAN